MRPPSARTCKLDGRSSQQPGQRTGQSSFYAEKVVTFGPLVPDWVHDILSTRMEKKSAARSALAALFRKVSSAGKVWGKAITEKLVWHVVKEFAAKIGVQKLAPHDLRRSRRCARRSGHTSHNAVFGPIGHGSALHGASVNAGHYDAENISEMVSGSPGVQPFYRSRLDSKAGSLLASEQEMSFAASGVPMRGLGKRADVTGSPLRTFRR